MMLSLTPPYGGLFTSPYSLAVQNKPFLMSDVVGQHVKVISSNPELAWAMLGHETEAIVWN